MKKKITKILGVGLAFVVVASLFGFAVPTSADPGNVMWEPFDIPGPAGPAGGYVLQPTIRALGPIESIGDTIYVGAWDDVNGNGVVDSTPGVITEIMIYKSVDGGRTWAPTFYNVDTEVVASWAPSIAWPITDICIIDANTVYVTNGHDVFKTIDGGANWIPLTNLANYMGWGPISVITAIDVGYIGTDTYVFAGTSNFGVGGTGGAYVCWEWALGMPWNDLQIDTNRPPSPFGWTATAADVYDIRCDPSNFATTQAVMAITRCQAGACIGPAFTVFTTKHLGHQWNSYVGDGVFYPGNVAGTYVTGTFFAQMWLPENFDYSLLPLGAMEVMVSIASTVGGEGDVYRVVGGLPDPTPCVAPGPGSFTFDLNIGTVLALPSVNAFGLDGAGISGGAVLLAGGDVGGSPVLFRTANNGGNWLPNAKRPTGGTWPGALWFNPAFNPYVGFAMPYVTVADDFATSGIGWTATQGWDCGVSLTEDFGNTSNTIGLIRTNIDSLQDFTINAAGDVMFLGADDTAGSGTDSIWRYDGFWERVFSDTLSAIAGDDPEWVEFSPDGTTVYMMDGDGAAGGWWPYFSLDLGQSWTVHTIAVGDSFPGPNTIRSWVVLNSSTLLCGDNAGVVCRCTTANTPFPIWNEAPVPGMTGQIRSLVAEPGYTDPGAVMAGSTTGFVALSLTGGAAWLPATQPWAGGTAYPAFDGNYATNGFYYSTFTNGRVYRYDAPIFAWTRIDLQGQAGEFPVTQGRGIVSAAADCPTGASILYVATNVAGVGMHRTLNPTDALVGPTPPYWEVAPEGLAAQNFGDFVFFQNFLWKSDGAVPKLWSIDQTGVGLMGLYHYDDTLATCVTLISPANGDSIMDPVAGPWLVPLSWDALPGALDYQVQVDTRPDFLGGVFCGEVIVYVAGGTTATFTLAGGCSNNTDFYWRVRAAGSGLGAFPLGFGAPVRSYWSEVWSFTTSPPPPMTILKIVRPCAGCQDIEVNATFQWQQVWGASHYEWELADDSTFTNILDAQSPVDPFCQASFELDYDTTYSVRVRAMQGTTPFSDWVTWSFHTIVEPTSPVDVSDVTVPIEEITPVWIWVIIVIGALLVIAVVILIMTTRQR